MKPQLFKSFLLIALLGLTPSSSFGSGQSQWQSVYSSLLNAVDAMDLDVASSLLQRVTPGSIPTPELIEILTHALRNSLSSTQHSESINILNLFLKGDGNGFDLEIGNALDETFYSGIGAIPFLASTRIFDALRFVIGQDSDQQEAVFATLLKSRLGSSGLAELLWALQLNSGSLVKLVLANLHASIDLDILKPTVYSILESFINGISTADIEIVSALVDSQIEPSWEFIHSNISSILTNNALVYQLLERRFEKNRELINEWSRLYSASTVVTTWFPSNAAKQVRRLFGLLLLQGGTMSAQNYHTALSVAFGCEDELILKLLARQMPELYFKFEEEFPTPDGELLVNFRLSDAYMHKALFEKVNFYHRQYLASRLMKASRGLDEKVDSMNSQLRQLIETQTKELSAHPDQPERFPLAGQNIGITRSEFAHRSLTYLAAEMLLENNRNQTRENELFCDSPTN